MTNYLYYVAPDSIRSKFNPAVGIHADFIPAFNKNFLHPIFLNFCSELKIRPEELEFLPLDDIITEKEFEKSKHLELVKPYFYDIIFKAIFKNYAGAIKNPIRFTFTYDLELAPLGNSSARYGTISLGNLPILYYIYVDIQRAISFIKTLE